VQIYCINTNSCVSIVTRQRARKLHP
jgi:hypothetical protein